MLWSKLPTGEFTGIDWASPGATSSFDPYLNRCLAPAS